MHTDARVERVKRYLRQLLVGLSYEIFVANEGYFKGKLILISITIFYPTGQWLISSDGNRKCALAYWCNYGGNSRTNRKRKNFCSKCGSYPFYQFTGLMFANLQEDFHWILKLKYNDHNSLKLSTPIEGQDRISPYNFSTTSGRQLMGIMKNIN